MNLKPLLLLLLASSAALAQAPSADTAPDLQIKNVSSDVLQIIRSDKDIQAGNSGKAIELIETKVLPNFNFMHMTQLAVGRDWKSANAGQQKQLADEFHTLLVRTYARALTEYKNQTIEFKPFKMAAGASEAKVRSQVSQAGAKPIPLDYFLEKMATGWKVYDIEVDGISLVISYRESFATEVRNGGIDGLIKSLQDKNRAGVGGARK